MPALRARDPVHRSRLLKAWLFTRHGDVAAILSDHRHFGNDPRTGTLTSRQHATRRDWAALGGSEADVIPLGKFRQGAEIPQAAGILFATYATLRSPARQGKRSRLEQIVGWLAGGTGRGMDEDTRHGFEGVIVFDEAHAMANAAGAKGSRGDMAPSQQGRAGLRLQNALPDARVLYVSATGATTVPGLAYARRLGLWGATDSGGETPFEQRSDFVTAMEAGGVAAMEVVARDLKALGLYQARALSYAGVVQQRSKNSADARFQAVDRFGCKRLVHQRPEPRVIGRVEQQHGELVRRGQYVLQQLVGGRQPQGTAAAAQPVVENDGGDLAALAAAGAVAQLQQPAQERGELRRQVLTAPWMHGMKVSMGWWSRGRRSIAW